MTAAPTAPPRDVNADYAELRRLIRSKGLLESQDRYYALKLTVAVATIALAAGIAVVASHPLIILADAIFLAFAFTQAALLAHDIVHKQAFRSEGKNEAARLFVGNLLLGLSYSWWKMQHNQHHANPNHIDKDPDIQLPFIVFAAEKIAEQPRWLHPLIAIQSVMILLLFPIQAIFMRIVSVQHLIVDRPRGTALQAILMVVHFALYAWLLVTIGGWLAVGFAAIHQMVFGFYNSTVFASNHKGMPLTADGKRLDFFREQVMVSRDVRGHPLTDFWYGGLNYQIEHHLFPTMPRNKLAEAQPIIRAFCEERGVKFHVTSLVGAYGETFAHLNRESASLRRRGAEV